MPSLYQDRGLDLYVKCCRLSVNMIQGFFSFRLIIYIQIGYFNYSAMSIHCGSLLTQRSCPGSSLNRGRQSGWWAQARATVPARSALCPVWGWWSVRPVTQISCVTAPLRLWTREPDWSRLPTREKWAEALQTEVGGGCPLGWACLLDSSFQDMGILKMSFIFINLVPILAPWKQNTQMSTIWNKIIERSIHQQNPGFYVLTVLRTSLLCPLFIRSTFHDIPVIFFTFFLYVPLLYLF